MREMLTACQNQNNYFVKDKVATYDIYIPCWKPGHTVQEWQLVSTQTSLEKPIGQDWRRYPGVRDWTAMDTSYEQMIRGLQMYMRSIIRTKKIKPTIINFVVMLSSKLYTFHCQHHYNHCLHRYHYCHFHCYSRHVHRHCRCLHHCQCPCSLCDRARRQACVCVIVVSSVPIAIVLCEM